MMNEEDRDLLGLLLRASCFLLIGQWTFSQKEEDRLGSDPRKEEEKHERYRFSSRLVSLAGDDVRFGFVRL